MKRNKRHIYLTGFMGAGKSKIGPLLARELGIFFMDSDKLIEEKSGKTIFDIFTEDGELYFRDLESGIIEELAMEEEPVIIALGGGALNRPQNCTVIEETGWTIYIKSSPEAIYNRVRYSNKRPLLKIEPGPDQEERLLFRIRELLEQREPVYETADFILDRDVLELEEIVTTLKSQVQKIWESDRCNR